MASIHSGHRQRVKQEFLARGLAVMPDHRVLELLLFLSCLEPAMSQGEQRACTPFQVRLARDVIAYVDAHRDRRVTAAQLGRELGVSTCCFWGCPSPP